jgi:hypothetical protein
MVHHDDIPGRQGGAQHLLDIGAKDLRVSGAVDGHHRLEALDTEGAQRGDSRPVVLAHAAYDPLPLGVAAIQPGQGPINAQFIATCQAPEMERRQPLAVDCTCLLDARRVAL